VIPDIVALAHDCEVLSIRGYVFLITGYVWLDMSTSPAEGASMCY